jgi:hypothetical protein
MFNAYTIEATSFLKPRDGFSQNQPYLRVVGVL